MGTSRIAVIGDLILDRYLIGDTERLSPEAPVPVVTVREHRSALGGAANVAANVAAMGATCQLVGVVGDDPTGRALRAEMATLRLTDDQPRWQVGTCGERRGLRFVTAAALPRMSSARTITA